MYQRIIVFCDERGEINLGIHSGMEMVLKDCKMRYCEVSFDISHFDEQVWVKVVLKGSDYY